MNTPFLHPQARSQDRGCLRGSLKPLEPFLLLGLILPNAPDLVLGPLPQHLFRLEAGPHQTCLGYLLLLGANQDPELTRGLTDLLAGKA